MPTAPNWNSFSGPFPDGQDPPGSEDITADLNNLGAVDDWRGVYPYALSEQGVENAGDAASGDALGAGSEVTDLALDPDNPLSVNTPVDRGAIAFGAAIGEIQTLLDDFPGDGGDWLD